MGHVDEHVEDTLVHSTPSMLMQDYVPRREVEKSVEALSGKIGSVEASLTRLDTKIDILLSNTRREQ